MNWTTLGAWIYKDDTYVKAICDRHNIGVIYIDPRSGNAQQVAASVRADNRTAGVYYVPGWTPGPTPQQHAQIVSDYVQKAGIIVTGEPVMLDLEQLSIPWVEAFLKSYRQHLPQRPTAYTNEPFQNETVVPVATLQKYGLHWYPQTYYGDMSPADSAAVMLEVSRIYDPTMVHPFYDGAHLPADVHDGCIFTLERLP
jgi:hypothetical protein